MIFVEVDPLHEPIKVRAIGFDVINEDLEMLRWLRKGNDVSKFVVGDVEHELYAQDSGSQLLSVQCLRKSEYQTKALKKSVNDTQVVVSQFRAVFLLLVKVQSSDEGDIWKLEIQHGYHASYMEKPDDFALRLDFTIIIHQQG